MQASPSDKVAQPAAGHWWLRNFGIALAITFVATVVSSVIDSWNETEFIVTVLQRIVGNSLVGFALFVVALALWGHGAMIVYLFAQGGVSGQIIVRLTVAAIPVALTMLGATDDPPILGYGLTLGIGYALTVRMYPRAA